MVFFARDKLLVEGNPVSFPTSTDTVIAVIDIATKTGSDNDCMAVTYFAKDPMDTAYPLRILDLLTYEKQVSHACR